MGIDREHAHEQHDQQDENDEIHGNRCPSVKNISPSGIQTGGWGAQGTAAMKKHTIATISNIRPGLMARSFAAQSPSTSECVPSSQQVADPCVKQSGPGRQLGGQERTKGEPRQPQSRIQAAPRPGWRSQWCYPSL